MRISERTARGAAAGAAAALVWAATEPLDKPIFRCAYSDVEFLGKSVTRTGPWRAIGLVMHVANGALFGAVYAELKARAGLRIRGALLGLAAGIAEHMGTWPLTRFADRLHPAREELVSLNGNRAAFLQATWRHALFGVALGVFEETLNGVASGSASPKPRKY